VHERREQLRVLGIAAVLEEREFEVGVFELPGIQISAGGRSGQIS
jgi:hypothetical protein